MSSDPNQCGEFGAGVVVDLVNGELGSAELGNVWGEGPVDN